MSTRRRTEPPQAPRAPAPLAGPVGVGDRPLGAVRAPLRLLPLWLLAHVVVTLTAGVPRWVLVAGSLGTTPGPLAFFALNQRLIDRPGRPKRMAAAVPLTVVGVGIARRTS